MNRRWFGFREPAVAEGFGARPDGQVPIRAGVRSVSVPRRANAVRSWWAPAARLIRNALIAAVAMSIVPLAVVTVRGDHLARALYGSNANVTQRMLVVAQPVRAFGVERDPSITPMQAGLALNAMQYRRSVNQGFVSNEPVARLVRPWRVNRLAADMFVTARPDMYDGPSSRAILEASAKGFSQRERAYLRELAESPIWREFDVVARAPAVDMVGGQLRIPFETDALPEQRPLASYRDSKELAYAAISRAAYYMSVGRPREAEQVLRSIVSFGFAYIDNGTTTLDELIGTVIVGIGRDALQRFYTIENDARATLPELAAPAKGTFLRSSGASVKAFSAAEVRQLLLARLADPAVPRPERFETVRELSLLSCTSARELLFGERADVREAIERARNEFARYPSERALVDLGTRLPSAARVSAATGPLQSLFVSPAMVAGAVLHNPRMGACTLFLTAGR